MINQLKNRNSCLLLATDVFLFALSLFQAYFLRFTFHIPAGAVRELFSILPWVIGVKIVAFLANGVYRGMYRYFSLPDAWRLTKASILATLVILAGLTYVNRFQGYSRSVFIADSIFTLFFCGGVRAGVRVLLLRRSRIPGLTEEDDTPPHKANLIIIGAGDAADKIIREIQHNVASPFKVVCCLDDDADKHHRSLLGVPIRGPVSHLKRYAESFHAEEALIAMPSVTGERMRAIVDICEHSGLVFRTIPSLSSLLEGDITINDIRPVNYEDLLGRPPVKLDQAVIGDYLAGKIVAVTGAGGSIGSELCRQIVRFNPKSLILIEGSEFNLYRIEMELRTEKKFTRVFPAMGRVQDKALMTKIFEHYRPEVLFHAAACKHVPMVELNPWEAVHNNVKGSAVVMDVAEAYGTERCVFISTDKAVRPTNVMGASKRVVEILLQSRLPGKTRFMAVRFGNVVGSSGSAIPLFQSQIKAGGPVTVTHPEMTRYFMTIPEACQLVLQAGAYGDGGEIFVLQMGTPVNIADMARDLIRLSGKEPDRDIQIVYTGLRPGEKLYEELITHGEGIAPTSHEKIMVLRRKAVATTECRDRIASQMDELSRNAARYDADQIKLSLKALVPEYTYSDSASVFTVESRLTSAV